MDEHDSSTPNEDCWHTTYGNFCKCDQALSPIFGRGLGTRLFHFFLLLPKPQISAVYFPSQALPPSYINKVKCVGRLTSRWGPLLTCVRACHGLPDSLCTFLIFLFCKLNHLGLYEVRTCVNGTVTFSNRLSPQIVRLLHQHFQVLFNIITCCPHTNSSNPAYKVHIQTGFRAIWVSEAWHYLEFLLR